MRIEEIAESVVIRIQGMRLLKGTVYPALFVLKRGDTQAKLGPPVASAEMTLEVISKFAQEPSTEAVIYMTPAVATFEGGGTKKTLMFFLYQPEATSVRYVFIPGTSGASVDTGWEQVEEPSGPLEFNPFSEIN